MATACKRLPYFGVSSFPRRYFERAPPHVARVPRRATATTSARRSSRYVQPRPVAAHQRCAQPLKNLRFDDWGISHFETRQKSQVDHIYIYIIDI